LIAQTDSEARDSHREIGKWLLDHAAFLASLHCEERQRRSNPAFLPQRRKLDCFASLAMTAEGLWLPDIENLKAALAAFATSSPHA